MKVSFVLPHDFRFSEWSVNDFLRRYHFSKKYLDVFAKITGSMTKLYILHQDISDAFTVNNISFLPIDFYFPPFLKFGNEFSSKLVAKLLLDNPDIVHVFNYYVWSYPLIVYKLANRIPVVAQFHGIVDHFSSLKLLAFRNSYTKTKIFLTSFYYEKKKLIKLLKINSDRVKIFPNVGVSFELFKPFRKSITPKILYVGRFPRKIKNKWEKNPLLVIKLFEALRKRIHDLTLEMVGDGPGFSRVMNYIKKKKLEDHVSLRGYVEHARLPRIYSNAWFTVIPMYFPEMTYLWDGSLKESLACGTPVILFGNHFNLADWGLMISYSRPDKDVEKILNIFKRYDMYFGDVKSIRNTLKEKCSWEALIKNLVKIYETVGE